MYLHSIIPRKGYQTSYARAKATPRFTSLAPSIPNSHPSTNLIYHSSAPTAKLAMHNPPRLSLDNTILTSPLYRRSSHRANTSVDADIYCPVNQNMSSSSREKATPPASPVLRGRSLWRAGDVPVKTKRSRTLGRVAVLLMLLGVLGYAVMGWGVCG